MAEAARCAEKFRKAGVGVSLTVTPCWCYGSETMDMDPHLPKAVWGFNGTERPGAVYLAAVSAAHNQKGLPVFNIYGRDVQDAGDTTIPGDVQEKLLRFASAGLAVANMRGKSYLGMGGVSMGIAGSIVNHDFFERYLGMRVETIDMVEFVRRMEQGIYDPEEYETRLRLGAGELPRRQGLQRRRQAAQPRSRRTRTGPGPVKMALIARDLMIGNPRLAELGFGEEALGHNAIAAGFQGQRQWTDHLPNGDFLEAILNSSFDWNGIRAPLHRRHRERRPERRLHAVRPPADQRRADLRRRAHLLEPGRGQARHRLRADRPGGRRHPAPDQLRPGDARRHRPAERNGEPAMKPFWEITPEEAEACLKATTWHAGDLGYFRGGGWSTRFRTRGGMPVTMCRINLVQGLGPACRSPKAGRWNCPTTCTRCSTSAPNPTWPTTWFVPRTTGSGPFRDVYTVMNNWGANHGAIGYGHFGADLISLCAMLRIPVYMHNVPEEQHLPPQRVDACSAPTSPGGRLPRLRELRAAVRVRRSAEPRSKQRRRQSASSLRLCENCLIQLAR